MAKEFEKPAPEVTRRMKRVKSRGTNLEREMEGILKNLPVTYERQPNLIGHPDFRIEGTRVLIFCDSSFWHGRRRDDVTGRSFRKNKEFWTSKIASNKIRDRRISKTLTKEDWIVLRFWDTDIEEHSDIVAEKIRRSLQ
jgi:DNA mismatch endonuclease (patch repair protein)